MLSSIHCCAELTFFYIFLVCWPNIIVSENLRNIKSFMMCMFLAKAYQAEGIALPVAFWKQQKEYFDILTEGSAAFNYRYR